MPNNQFELRQHTRRQEQQSVSDAAKSRDMASSADLGPVT